MAAKSIGIIMNGATSGICNRQHLPAALVPIIREGGLNVGGEQLMPELLLVGRDAVRLQRVADAFGLGKISTDLGTALSDPAYPVFFDAGITGNRARLIKAALEAGKDVYAEKPVVTDIEEGKALLALADRLGRGMG